MWLVEDEVEVCYYFYKHLDFADIQNVCKKFHRLKEGPESYLDLKDYHRDLGCAVLT